MQEEILPMRGTAPQGDYRLIPDSLEEILEGIRDDEKFVIDAIASAAKEARGWVGVGIILFCIKIGAAPPDSGTLSWSEWRKLYSNLPILQCFQQAERSEWIVITREGYACPIQDLADLVCKRT